MPLQLCVAGLRFRQLLLHIAQLLHWQAAADQSVRASVMKVLKRYRMVDVCCDANCAYSQSLCLSQIQAACGQRKMMLQEASTSCMMEQAADT